MAGAWISTHPNESALRKAQRRRRWRRLSRKLGLLGAGTIGRLELADHLASVGVGDQDVEIARRLPPGADVELGEADVRAEAGHARETQDAGRGAAGRSHAEEDFDVDLGPAEVLSD